MAEPVEQISDQIIEEPEFYTSHFWICSYPFFDTTLFLTPSADNGPNVDSQAFISLYDPDGDPVNDVEVRFPPGRVGHLELNSLLGSSKLEGGFKHGHMVVRSRKGVRLTCRLGTREKAAVLGKPRELSAGKSSFFPLLFAEDRSPFLAIVNHGSEETSVRCRLFCGKRIPETECLIPGYGARVISLEDEFPEYAVSQEGKKIQAYVRLGTKSSDPLGVLLLEQTKMLKDGDFYCSVS